MKTIALSIFCVLTSATACTQEKKDNSSSNVSIMKTIHTVPFLTKQNDFIYVDKTSLKPAFNQKFRSASTFTPTGFAVVENEKNEYAVINENGKIILDFSPEQISLKVTNGLTFYKKDIEYEKKMPVWKWDWNIMGGDIKKEQTYHKFEIGVLESKQIILEKDEPYLEESYDLNFISLDNDHVFWNGTLYEIKNLRLHKIENNIAELLENKRYIKASNSSFTVYELNKKKPIVSGLKGTETISIQYGRETILLKDVNKERYEPEVPKLLSDSKTNNLYTFPQYEKIFPKEIKQATPSQIDFIKKTSLVYSITNSPYFLLGVFDYDHDIWAYSWLYIDTKGNVVDSINTYDFKVLDQIGYVVWPDRKMILPNEFIDKNWKFGKITSYQGMDNLYLIRIENKKSSRTIGLWNSKSKTWEIQADYYDISVLDTAQQIYALQEEKDGLYTLYNNKTKKRIGLQAYNSINSDGLVTVKRNTEQNIYYYIDIYSGKEYKEN